MDKEKNIYSLQEAVSIALDLRDTYQKNYAVVKEHTGYAIIGARYAKCNAKSLTIEYITDLKK